MRKLALYRILAVPLVLSLAALACGGGASTPEPKDTEAPRATSTPKPEEGGPITSFRQAEDATIQIVAQGTFVDPQVGVQANAAGAGTGFIIDPSGLAVTNNHVVTGAARLKAYLNGQEYNAKLLGVSECSDLAVIQLEGENFPFMTFYGGSVDVGLEVYAAGFPLGDPEFTLTKGIVSKARAGGESDWASVESVIEHDATINPGNSGGPLINPEGEVVGINYAGNSGTNQYFAIKAQDARNTIDELAAGNDVDSLGVNGKAVVSDDGSIAGIWVSSVKSGSPADGAGLKGGDIILKMEGLDLAANGTMTEYCDIIRSHRPTDTLSIEVLRFETQELLAGQMNGRPLEATYSFANDLGSEVQNNTGGGDANYSGYVAVQDDANAITVEIPAEWKDTNGAAWTLDDNDVIGAAISAAPDLQAYNDTWTEPGMFFGVTDDIARLGGYVQVLDLYRDSFRDICTFESRNDYADSVYEGQYDVFSDCDGSGNVFVVLSARPINDPTAFLVVLQVNIMTDADLDALDHIYQTFDVIGSLP